MKEQGEITWSSKLNGYFQMDSGSTALLVLLFYIIFAYHLLLKYSFCVC